MSAEPNRIRLPATWRESPSTDHEKIAMKRRKGKGSSQAFEELDAVSRMPVRSIATKVPLMLQLATGRRTSAKLSATATRMLERALIEVLLFEKKSKRLRTLQITKRKKKLREELNALLAKVDPTMPSTEEPVSWRLKRIEEDLAADKYLPYLRNTKFALCQSEIGKLIDELYAQGNRGEILRLFAEFGTNPDIYSISQLFSAEMKHHYRFLCKTRKRIGEDTVWRYLRIYLDSCGVYEKDMSLVACLLQVRNSQGDVAYKKTRGERYFLRTVHYVQHRIPVLAAPFDKLIRDARAHVNVHIGEDGRSIVLVDRKGSPVEKTITDFMHLVEEMTATVLAFRLIVLQQNQMDWKTIDALLK